MSAGIGPGRLGVEDGAGIVTIKIIIITQLLAMKKQMDSWEAMEHCCQVCSSKQSINQHFVEVVGSILTISLIAVHQMPHNLR